MVENRINREATTREKVVRKRAWTRPEVLPSPNPEPGYAFRWVRVATQGQVDPTNVSSKLREGWEPVKASDHPEITMATVENEKFKDNVVIGGLSAVIQFVTIGSYSMIGGMSGIDKNVLPFSLAIGNRAKLRGLNLVGIRRNNFNKDEINKITSIHESFINKKINLSTNDKVEVIFHKYKSILNEKLGHIQK